MLNLQTNSKPQEIIKAYLEQNATQTLIDKINNGVIIEKNGKQLINRKTLDGFMKYASEEAKKLAETSSHSACVEDTVVFGWAMHYFQEDSIEETLYNADGTEYRQNTPTPKTKSLVSQKKLELPTTQYSLFDMINAKEPVSTSVDDDEPTEEEIQEAMQQIDCEQLPISQTDQRFSPVYEQYLAQQKEYPNAVILMRSGDFYEAYDHHAETLAKELDLTLTSRDCGLKTRIPVIGIPYHASTDYFPKIHSLYDIVVFEEPNEITFLPVKKQKETKHWISDTAYADDDGLVHETQNAIPDWLFQLFSGQIILR